MIGLLLGASYYYWGHKLAQKDEELFNLWSGIATGIVGTWLSVRIIDLILEKNRKEQSARVFALRNMRFLMNQASSAIEFSGRLEVDHLKKELHWAKGILSQRKKYFSADEIKELELFYNLIEQKYPELEALVVIKDQYSAGSVSGAHLKNAKDKVSTSMAPIEEARIAAEKNILRETDEE